MSPQTAGAVGTAAGFFLASLFVPITTVACLTVLVGNLLFAIIFEKK